MLQRSPGKALSMTSPLARQMARVRKTGSLDVPEKTRFLSPTAVLGRGQEGARKWVLKLYQFSGSAFLFPTAVLSRRQEGARNGFQNYISSWERPSIFFLDTLWKSPVGACT